MYYGRKVCEELKSIRKQIADANGIKYEPKKCNHQGDCAGTCPACDAELTYLERELSLRKLAGKAAMVAGLSVGIATLSSCHKLFPPQVNGYLEDPKAHVLEGDVPCVSPNDSTNTDSSTIVIDKNSPTKNPQK